MNKEIENFINKWCENDAWQSMMMEELNKLLQEDWISVEEPPKIHKDFEDETIMTTIEGFLITDGEKVVITKLVPEFWKTLGFETTHWKSLPKPPITKKRGGCNP